VHLASLSEFVIADGVVVAVSSVFSMGRTDKAVCRVQGRLRGRDMRAAGWVFEEGIFQCLGRTLPIW
jgi:hypothetical protein